MSAVCPNGHTSQAEDFCDTCGAKIDLENQPEPTAPDPAAEPAAESAAPAAAAPDQQVCPNCSAPNTPDALFCEACGYDFTTGALPRGASPKGSENGSGSGHGAAPATVGSIAPAIPLEWVAEVWVDPDWYAVQEADEPMPSPGLPAVVGLTTKSLLIGRVSPSRNIHPDIDCTTDTGVSRRHAQLTTDGQRWFVEDLGSSNGTFVGPASGPLPEDPIAVGPRTELDDDDRIYVGAWTRIVVRAATDDEKAAQTA
ncbi:MAG TPA: FHA domain-containing protein [Lapillicoccus sp.]|nr:FHA domain-containing protein [Lapillicoccus sp.]